MFDVSDKEDYTIPNYAITFSSWTTPGSSRWCVNIVIIDDNVVQELTLELVSMNPLVSVQENFSLVTVIIAEETTDRKYGQKMPNHVLSMLYLLMHFTMYRACQQSITIFSLSRCCYRNAVLIIESH